MPTAETAPITPLRPTVRCPTCQGLVFDGQAIRSRVVVLGPHGGQAKCRQCKAWVEVPATYLA